MRMTAPLLLVALLGAPMAARAADPRARGIDEHLQRLADSLAPHLPDLLATPRVEAVEKTAALARVRGQALEISTGLLSVMENDAQAAMILAHAMARASQAPARRSEAGGSRAERRADDEAAAAGIRAVIAAGYSGREAVEAWARLAPLSSLAEDQHALGDREDNARRADVARRVLRQSGQVDSTRSGLATGATAYRAGVLAHLRGWKVIDESAPAGAADAEARPDAGWLTYLRSGGITGWAVELRVGADGSTWVRESQRAAEAGPRAPVPPEALARLRGLVSAALARPARAMTPEARFLRDGMTRSLRVTEGAEDKTLGLSDGLELGPDDQALLRELELLVR